MLKKLLLGDVSGRTVVDAAMLFYSTVFILRSWS
jgi:hypothetical protein